MTTATLATPAAASHASEEFFAEFFDSRGRTLEVDIEKSIVRNVKLSGWESKNGRMFGEEARQDLFRLAEAGLPVNLNHHERDLGAPRDIRDRFGMAYAKTKDASGIYGEVHFNPKHDYAESFVWNAQNSPQSCGMSPVYAPKKSSRTREGKLLVESLKTVLSIDLVADPATTNSLREQKENHMSDTILAEQIAKNNDLQKTVDSLTTQVGTLTGEKNALAEQVRTLTAEKNLAESKQAVTGFIAEAKLPADSVAAETRESWETLAVSDADRAKKLVANFAEAYHRGNSKPKSEPPANSNVKPGDFDAKAAVKRYRS